MRYIDEDRPIGYNPEFVARVQASRSAKAREEARTIINQAKAEADRMLLSAKIQAARIVKEARLEADEILKATRHKKAMPVVVPQQEIASLRPIEVIAQEKAAELGYSLREINTKSRNAELVNARHQVMAAVYVERPDLSLPRIGRFFGRDHTTILAAVQKLGVWRGFNYEN